MVQILQEHNTTTKQKKAGQNEYIKLN